MFANANNRGGQAPDHQPPSLLSLPLMVTSPYGEEEEDETRVRKKFKQEKKFTKINLRNRATTQAMEQKKFTNNIRVVERVSVPRNVFITTTTGERQSIFLPKNLRTLTVTFNNFEFESEQPQQKFQQEKKFQTKKKFQERKVKKEEVEEVEEDEKVIPEEILEDD